jgi:hemerythrin
MLIVWKDEFSIDHGVIDDDHRFLFEFVSRILANSREEDFRDRLANELRILREFAVKHFTREEALQRASGFPEQMEHGHLHRDLLDQLDRFVELMNLPQHTGEPMEKMENSLRKTQSFLYRWLLSHILDHDMKMRPYVAAMAGAARELESLAAL